MRATVNSANHSAGSRWLDHSGRLFAISWSLIVASAVGLGWWYRDEGYLTAARGIGYWLGIIGASAMLLLLTYSARKRWSLLRRALPVKWWFQLHMSLGILGPLCIVFHSNFHLGSLNSSVALVCMLLVAGSGIIGRYIYNRIHFGLYGERIRLAQVHSDFQSLQQELSALAHSENQQRLCAELFAGIEQLVKSQQQAALSYRQRRRQAKHSSQALTSLIAALEQDRSDRGRTTQQLRDIHLRIQQDYAILLAIIRKLPGLSLYERLFSLWHVIHIPIFILMIITALIHVLVVHMY